MDSPVLAVLHAPELLNQVRVIEPDDGGGKIIHQKNVASIQMEMKNNYGYKFN